MRSAFVNQKGLNKVLRKAETRNAHEAETRPNQGRNKKARIKDETHNKILTRYANTNKLYQSKIKNASISGLYNPIWLRAHHVVVHYVIASLTVVVCEAS